MPLVAIVFRVPVVDDDIGPNQRGVLRAAWMGGGAKTEKDDLAPLQTVGRRRHVPRFLSTNGGVWPRSFLLFLFFVLFFFVHLRVVVVFFPPPHIHVGVIRD